jgi:hypothetical protein
MPSWQSIKNPQMILASNELTTEFFFCALLALAQCPPGRALQNSSEILFLLTLNRVPLCTPLHLLNACLAELLQNSSEILSATVSLHSLAS